MALPQRDVVLDEIRRIEGLMAYAEAHGMTDTLERLKAELKALLEKL